MLLNELKGKDIVELIASGKEKLASVPGVGAGGGGGAVAIPSSGGGAAPLASEDKEEKKWLLSHMLLLLLLLLLHARFHGLLQHPLLCTKSTLGVTLTSPSIRLET